jgi:GTPase
VVPVSAVSGEGIDALLTTLADLVDQGEPVTAQLPANDGRALAWLYRHGRIVDRTDAEDGTVRLSVRLDLQALGQFERLFPEALTSHAAE